ADEGLQILGVARSEEAALVAVGIQVKYGMFLQVPAVSLDPLDRAEQARFFAVPGAIDNGAFWSPALLVKFAEHSCLFKFRRHTGNRIVGAVDPGVMMVAANDPLTWR